MKIEEAKQKVAEKYHFKSFEDAKKWKTSIVLGVPEPRDEFLISELANTVEKYTDEAWQMVVNKLQKEIEHLKETDRINCIMIKELKAENERHKHNLCKLREQLDAYMIKEMNGEEKATPANVETKKIRVEVLDGATKCLMSEIGIQITIPICPF